MLGVHVIAPVRTLARKERLGRAIVVRDLDPEHTAKPRSHRVFQNLRSGEDFAKRTEAPASRFENPCKAVEVYWIGVKVERIEILQPVRLALEVGGVRKKLGAQKARTAAELGVGRRHRDVHYPGAAPKRAPSVLEQIARAGGETSRLMASVEVTGDRHRSRSRGSCGEKLRRRRI